MANSLAAFLANSPINLQKGAEFLEPSKGFTADCNCGCIQRYTAHLIGKLAVIEQQHFAVASAGLSPLHTFDCRAGFVQEMRDLNDIIRATGRPGHPYY